MLSGVASQSINDVFSATYNHYRIHFVYEPSTSANRTCTLRLRVGGVDASGTDYFNAAIGLSQANTASNEASGGGTSVRLANNQYYTSVYFASTLDIMSPFLAKTTTFLGQSNGYTASDILMLQIGAHHNTSTSYTGFTLLNSSGNFNTGVVSVYGYNK
jgi:hypothetical protein